MLLDCAYKTIEILYEAGYRTMVMEAAGWLGPTCASGLGMHFSI